MKNKELSNLGIKELKEILIKERDNLAKLKLSHAVSPIENPKKITYTRKKIARILTNMKFHPGKQLVIQLFLFL